MNEKSTVVGNNVTGAPRWVSRLFKGAAVFGLLMLLPLYLRRSPFGMEVFYYGFIGTAAAFQLVFWQIGGDPVRYRPLMLVGVVEKLVFGVPAVLLFLVGLGFFGALVAGGIDLALGLGFLLAWRMTPR